MSQAIKDLKDFLTKSPSVVFPDEVLEYVDAIESENKKLRELVQYICDENYGDYWFDVKAYKLGITAHY